jgi:outer membrane protein assembly factor BamB
VLGFRRLFLGNGGGTVQSFSTKTGERAWDFHSHRCMAASPSLGLYKHGTVYAAFLNTMPCRARRPNDGAVIALSVGFGVVRWERHIGASETSPLLLGNRLYVGDWTGMVYALDARTGKTVWTYKTGGAVKGALASSRDRVFVGSYDGHVYALNAKTGMLVWKAAGDPRLFGHGTFYSTPAVAYDRVYIGSTDGKVYSFGEQTGKRRWSHSTGGYVYGSPAVWNKRVYVGSYDDYFYAFDAATGAQLWRFKANGPISGSATVVDGVVYFATLKGRTYGLDAMTGRQLWSFPDGKYSPVVADTRRLYLLGFGVIYGLVPR